jgi:hypothetical protein
MKIVNPEEVERKAKEKYNEQPLGWKILYTVDKRGYPSVGLVNRHIGEQYWIKLSSPFSPRGVGTIATLNEEFPVLNDPSYDKDFGIRFLELTDKEKEKAFKGGKIISSVSEKIRRAFEKDKPEPEDTRKIRIVGPYPDFAVNDLGDISPAQRELEAKMQDEIERLTKRQTCYIS